MLSSRPVGKILLIPRRLLLARPLLASTLFMTFSVSVPSDGSNRTIKNMKLFQNREGKNGRLEEHWHNTHTVPGEYKKKELKARKREKKKKMKKQFTSGRADWFVPFRLLAHSLYKNLLLLLLLLLSVRIGLYSSSSLDSWMTFSSCRCKRHTTAAHVGREKMKRDTTTKVKIEGSRIAYRIHRTVRIKKLVLQHPEWRKQSTIPDFFLTVCRADSHYNSGGNK